MAVNQITREKLGQSTGIGIGGDPIIGTTFVEALELFKDDEQTAAVVMIGEIGGSLEEQAARIHRQELSPSPSSRSSPARPRRPGRRMGHAGAIISGGRGTAAEKMAVLRENGVHVVENPAEIGATVKKILG